MKLLITIVLFGLGIIGVATAETTTFRQQILPIDCIYEVIDAGVQKLRYITPDTCPIDPGPPVITEPPTSPIATEQLPQNNSIVRWSSMPPITGMPIQQQPEVSVPEDELQGVIFTVKDAIIQNMDSIALVVSGVCVWWLLVYASKKSNKQD